MMVQVVILGGSGKESSCVEPCPTKCIEAPASTLPGAEQPSGGDSDSLTPILVVRLIVGSGSFPLGKKQPC